MEELEKMPGKKKWTDYQKDYNLSSKTFMQIIGSNISLFVCLLIPLLLIGFIWTDLGPIKFDVRFMSDAIVTMALFVIGENLMMRVGASGGKLDSEYINTKAEYDSIIKSVNSIGTLLLPVFCEWQIDCELSKAKAIRLRYLRFTREDWEKVKDLPQKELIKKYGIKKAHRIIELNRLEPVELNESILLFNGSDGFARGGVPISGEDYIDKKSHSVTMILSALFTGLLTVSVALTLTSDISFARVMYTAFKLVILLFRMAQGYDIGARAYNSIEVKQLKAKNNYLRQYMRFVNDKLYLKLGNKYGDISCFVSSDDITTTQNS